MNDRVSAAGAIALPILSMTVYLLWIWPRPSGVSALAELGPYLASLLTGLPFAWRLMRGRRRPWWVLLYLGAGFAVLWIHALAVLCGARGVCL